MTSTIVKVIWADFGSISYPLERLFLSLRTIFSTRLKRNSLIFNLCSADETRKLLEAIIVRTG